MANNLTVYKLLHFDNHLLNDTEKELFDFAKTDIDRFISTLNEGKFYLGGQIKMQPDEEIGLKTIERVREINKKRELEYGGPCNSFEARSIMSSKLDLEIIEKMIIKYNEIMKIREYNNKLLNQSDLDYNI